VIHGPWFGLVHASADPFLWNQALETATMVYNVGPTSGRSPTPMELFFGVKPDVSVLRTWGCVAHVHIPTSQRSVFGPQTIPGVFTRIFPPVQGVPSGVCGEWRAAT
jgi:hypothetical protein